jgi:ribosomal protein S18 acetylase RimI-like enzyme
MESDRIESDGLEGDRIEIERRLPDHLRDGAVVLFEEAFGDKMRSAIPDRSKRMAFMSRVYDARHVVAARQGDALLGMVGLSTRDGDYRGGLMDIGWDPRPYRELLGWWGALRAIANLRMAAHRPARGELYIDGIAVSPLARSRGIGTRLLGEVAAIAREQGMHWVRLHVIDSNPRARALYERVGYRVTKVESFRYLERWIGFGGLVWMELPLDGQESDEPTLDEAPSPSEAGQATAATGPRRRS